MEEATPEENQELERAFGAVSEALFGNDKSHKAMVNKMDPQDKVGSAASVSTLLITEVDKKINIDEGVIAGLVPPTVDAVIETFEKARQVEFSDTETTQALATTMEAVLATYGVDPESYEAFLQEQGLDNEEALGKAEGAYKGMLNE